MIDSINLLRYVLATGEGGALYQLQPTFVDDASAMFECRLLKMDPTGAGAVLRETIARSSREIVLERVVVPALERIGRDWEEGRVALSQVYMSGRIAEDVVELVLPAATACRGPHPRLAIAVLEDHHLLGKRIVSSMIRASGFDLLDLGTMDADSLIARALEEEIELLLISTLMLPSALRVGHVVEGLQKAGWEGKVFVGGAPFRYDDRLWIEVGADATSGSASGAVRLVEDHVGTLP